MQSKFQFIYADLFADARGIDSTFNSWVSGPASHAPESGNFWHGLKYFCIGEKVLPLKVGDSQLADHFLSVFDERRLNRVWQDSQMVATSIVPEILADAQHHPVRFFTSIVPQFKVVQGLVLWNHSAKLLSSSSLPPKGDKSQSPFVERITGIPIAVSTSPDKAVSILTLESAGSGEARLITPFEDGNHVRESRMQVEILYRNELIGTFYQKHQTMEAVT